MTRIRTIKQLTSKTTSVAVNAYDSVIETVALTDAADTSFVFDVENYVVKRTSCIQLTTEYPALNGRTTRAVTLTGTSGTANVIVDDVEYLATFASNLTTTATNFVTAHATALLALGITVTASSGVLTFAADTDIFPTITVENATTDLDATLGTVTNVASTGVPVATLESYERGVMTVRVTNVGSASLNGWVRIHFKITHN